MVSPILRRRSALLIAIFAAGTCMSACARADVLDDWVTVFLNAIRAENSAPELSARNLAILTVAAFDAVNDATGAAFVPYRTNAALGRPAHPEAAAAAAFFRTGSSLFPARKAEFTALWRRQEASFGSGPEIAAAIQLGHAAADALLSARVADGSNTQVPYIPSAAPGAWRRTPPFFRPPETPHWTRVKPFSLERGNQFRPPGPPALNGDRYAAEFNEVRRLGAKNSSERTPRETESARFWSDFSATVTPPGHWNQLTLSIADHQQLPFRDKARLLALVNLAMADAGIASWDTKYAFNFWRPVTAIRRADEDGNPGTERDENWEPLLITPSFPEYASGHSTFSGAAGGVITNFFGRDDLKSTATSDTLPGVTREYLSVSAVVDEIGRSRIWGGIHFESADKDGQQLGRRVADWVMRHELLPASPSSATGAKTGPETAGTPPDSRR